MQNIIIPQDQGFSFGRSINDLFRLMMDLERQPDSSVTLDFSQCRFLNPVFLLGARLMVQHYQRLGRQVQLNTDCHNRFFQDYLQLTHFTEGFQPAALSVAVCNEVLQRYFPKTYLPLTVFPLGLSDEATSIRENLQAAIATHIKTRLCLSGQVYESVSYLITEMVNNINDHSRQQDGYLFTQFYPSKGYIDIGFADIGTGFLGSYQLTGHRDITTHEAAIKAGRMGQSTKDDPQRGFGFRTSRSLLVDGLGGKYFLFSGDAFLYNDKETPETIRTLKIKPLIAWPGALVAMRIPMIASPDFNIYHYLE